MEKEEYKIMFNIEDSYWWYVGLRQLVTSYINEHHKSSGINILDAGCGTGGMLDKLRAYDTYAVDYSEEAIRHCKLRNIDNISRGSISQMPYRDNSFDVVISLDVLYHKNIGDDVETLKEINRVMKRDGVLYLNLPAYNFLHSNHDRAVHTKRRYTVKELRRKVQEAGFKIEKATYRNIFLFPLAVAKRIVEKTLSTGSEGASSELKPMSASINNLFTRLLLFENKLIRSGFSLPFGLSIYCIARKS